MKKFIKYFSIVTFSTILFASCSNTEPDNTTEPDTKVTENVEPDVVEEKNAPNTNTENIVLNTVSTFGGTDPKVEVYQDIISAYEDKNTHITVNDVSATVDETWKTAILTDFAVGNEPDVLFYFTGIDAQQLIENDNVVSIEEIREVYPDYGNTISDAAISFMLEDDGNSYALPVVGFWEGLFVNTDLFEEYGLELPTTWDNLITAIEVFSENDIVPIAASFADVPHYLIEHFVLTMAGNEGHKYELTAGEPIPEEWIKAFNLFYEFNEMGAFPKNAMATNNEAVGQSFKDKNYAMVLDGSWFLGGIEDKDNTTVMAFPSHPDGTKDPSDIIAGFSNGFYITRKAWEDETKRDAAVQFVNEMTSVDSIANFSLFGGAPAAEIDPPTSLTPLEIAGLEFSSTAKHANMPIDSKMSKEAWNHIINNISNIADGSMSSEVLLEEAANLN